MAFSYQPNFWQSTTYIKEAIPLASNGVQKINLFDPSVSASAFFNSQLWGSPLDLKYTRDNQTPSSEDAIHFDDAAYLQSAAVSEPLLASSQEPNGHISLLKNTPNVSELLDSEEINLSYLRDSSSQNKMTLERNESYVDEFIFQSELTNESLALVVDQRPIQLSTFESPLNDPTLPIIESSKSSNNREENHSIPVVENTASEVDNTPPEPPTLISNKYDDQGALTTTGQGEPGATIEIYGLTWVHAMSLYDCRAEGSIGLLGTTTVDANGQWSFTQSGSENGNYSFSSAILDFTYRQVDTSGNTSDYTGEYQQYLDYIPPDYTLLTPVDFDPSDEMYKITFSDNQPLNILDALSIDNNLENLFGTTNPIDSMPQYEKPSDSFINLSVDLNLQSETIIRDDILSFD